MDEEIRAEGAVEEETPVEEGLFADEAQELAEISAEAESQGEEVAGDPAPEVTPAPAEDPPTEEPAAEEPPTEDAPAEDTPSESAAPEEAPPKGFVKHGAFHEERERRKALQSELESLRLQMEDLHKAQGEAKPVDEFKRLSDDEFAELQEEDPDAAMLYLKRDSEHRMRQAEQANSERQRKAVEAANLATAQEAWDEITAIVPDITEPGGGTVAKRLTDFAAGHGFDMQMLNAMSNPGARISVPDQDGNYHTLPMARGATSLVKLLAEASKTNPDDIRQEVIAGLTEEITRKVTAEITGKIKNPDRPSVTEAAYKAEGAGTVDLAEMTDDQWAALPKKERDRYLGG